MLLLCVDVGRCIVARVAAFCFVCVVVCCVLVLFAVVYGVIAVFVVVVVSVCGVVFVWLCCV